MIYQTMSLPMILKVISAVCKP